MSKFLADTTVLVDMLRGNIFAKKFLEESPYISKVTLVELLQGCENKEDLKVVEKACDLLPQIKIDLAIKGIESIPYLLNNTTWFRETVFAIPFFTKASSLPGT